MNNKFLRLKVLIIVLLMSSSSYSQSPNNLTSYRERLNLAVELFNAGKFKSALHEFELVRQQSDISINIEEETAFYIALCNTELGNSTGRKNLENFIETHPESAHINAAYFTLANTDYALKRYKQAQWNYSRVDRNLLSSDQLDEYCFKYGFCFLETGEIDKAIALFNESKNNNKGKYTDASRFYTGHIDFIRGDYDAAQMIFNSLGNSAEYAPLIPYYKAHIAYARGNYYQVIELAQGLYKQASEKQKTDLARILAVSFYKVQKYDQAMPYIENYLKTSAISAPEYYVAGYCYNKTGQLDKAISNFEKATGKKDSIAQNAYYQLAGAYISKGDKKRAMMAFQNASEMKFDQGIREDALFQYAKITYELDYSPFNESIRAFDRYISEYPSSGNNDEAYNYLVKVFMTTRNYKDALLSLEKIKNKNTALKKAYQRVSYNRGIELYRDLKFSEALNMFNKSLEYGDNNNELKALAYYWRGEADFRLGRGDDALADYKRFQGIPGITNRKEYNISNYNIGYVLFNKDQFDAAKASFSKYLEGRPDKNSALYSDALNRTGDCYFGQRNFNEAISFYQKAFETGSSDADYALFQKAFCQGLLQNQQGKISDLNMLQSKFPRSNYIDDALFETGKAYEQMKSDEKAIANYQLLIQKFPDSPYKPKALVQLGLIAYNKNDYSASVKYYKQVAENFKNSPESKAAMAGIKNSYLESNKVEEYLSYTRSLGQGASPSENEKDSLTYISAEKLYMAKDPRAKEELGKYLDNFPAGSFGLNAHFYKADCELRENNFEEAIVDYEYVLSQPDNVFTENALINASELLYKTGDYKKSLNYYEKLEKVSGNNENLLLALAGQMRCNYELKNFNGVSRIGYRLRTMEKIPSELDREATYKSAKALIELNESAKAVPLWRKLSNDTKSQEGAEAKYRMCEFYYNSGKYKETENEVMDFIDKSTPHQYWLAKSFILLAHSYEKQNDLFQATHTLKSVIENYSDKNDGIVSEAELYLRELETKTGAAEKKQTS